MDEKLIENIASKLGFQHNPRILEKIKENTRLLQLKQNPMISAIGEMAKVVLCTDLAASAMGLSIDTATAVRMCGTRKSIYANYRRTLEKLIGATKAVGIPELCLQMGLPRGVQEAAMEELPKYLKYMERINGRLDREHPQYAALVLYRIARQRRVKVSKVGFTNACCLRTEQWKLLEASWERYAVTTEAQQKPSSAVESSEDVEMPEEAAKVAENEDYKVWKERILARAHEQLKRKQ